ncbi:MAG: hypothetical protein R3F19_03235 [Verrucomicrobiales bacterium]
MNRNPLLITACIAVALMTHADAQFEELWRAGEDDNSQADFVQEQGINDPPGDPFLNDDDFYFKGIYDDPIGTLDEDEDWANFERAVTSGDPTVRLHFYLDAEQAHPLAQYRLSFDMIALGSAADGAGTHDLEYRFNDDVFESITDLSAELLVQSEGTASDFGAVEGENVITITRTGGTDSSWIQFDYVQMEIDTSQAGCEDPLCVFSSSAATINPGGAAMLTWVGSPDATFSVDQGVGSVDDETQFGAGSIEVTPNATTTYTITATLPDNTTATKTVTVAVRLITLFTSNTSAVPEGNSASLMWNVHPDATLSISPGVGDIDNGGGTGTVDVTPVAPSTTYTLTATLGEETATAEVTVLISSFVRLWQIGEDDESQGDFSQEMGVNPPPGNPVGLDDDYYLAGTYPDPIGIVEQDEPWTNFERAVTSGDSAIRVHFNLDDVQAHPEAVYRIGFDMFALGSAADGLGIHDLEYRMNDELLSENLQVEEPVYIERIVPSGDVNAVAGENVIEVTRVGGTDGSWIQFDFISFEVDTSAVGCSEAICNFASDRVVLSAGQSVTLSWVAHPSAELSLSPDTPITSENGQGNIVLMPENNTTYTLTSTLNGVTDTREISVRVRAVESYTSTVAEVRAGEAFFLDWRVDPAAQVSISGIGAVDEQTFDGVGQIEIAGITATTTYTITATRGADVETQTVTVAFNPFSDLWQIGNDDGSQAEFAQENGNQNDLPGDPATLDDDYYFAGTYEDELIGTVDQDEEWATFERALTSGDLFSRIHFNLTDEEAALANEFRLTVDLILLGSGGEESTHDLQVSFNDTVIGEQLGVISPLLWQPIFSAESAGAVPGENLITIERTGGSGGSWIQFDYVALEINAMGAGGPADLRFSDIALNKDNGNVVLTWTSRPDKTYLVESTEDFVQWEELTDGHQSEGEETTYTDVSGFPATSVRYYRVTEE